MLARSPYIYGEALARLTEIPAFNDPLNGPGVRLSVLRNDKLPLKVALKFLNKYIDEKESLKGNTDRKLFMKRVEAGSLIAKMAARKDLPPEMLKKLAKTSDNAEVLADVAMNVNTPPPTLRILAKERDFAIKLAVAKNPSSPISALITVLKTAKTEFPDDTGRHNRQRQQLADAVQDNPNYTIAGRVKAGASDLLRRLVKEELEAVFREKGIKIDETSA